MLKQLHNSHQGVCKTKELAKQHVYWPGIVSDITNLVLACEICNMYTRSNKRNELLNHEIPDVPFDKVGADIASYGGKDYLIIVDYYSKWVEVCKLKWKTAQEISKKCKKVFASFGIPSVFVADNMPFNSIQFRAFAKEWGIQINNSSPNYPVSNGLVEKYVGIIQNFLKKCNDTNDEFENYLLSYRNTPLMNISKSPANLLQNRILKTKLPIKIRMDENDTKLIKQKMVKNQVTQKMYFDSKGTVEETDYKEGEQVWLQNKFNKTWSEARVIKKLDLPRCYLVKDNSGKELRRNIIFMRKKENAKLGIRRGRGYG